MEHEDYRFRQFKPLSERLKTSTGTAKNPTSIQKPDGLAMKPLGVIVRGARIPPQQ